MIVKKDIYTFLLRTAILLFVSSLYIQSNAQSKINEAESILSTECDQEVAISIEQKTEAQLRKMQKSVPLDYNQYVQNYINVYTLRKKSTAEKCLGRSKQFFPIFEQAFAKQGVPRELIYLSVIESALNPLAVSRKGATGPFQFMYSTAKVYGLSINKYVDERKDLYLSAEAAARYLQAAYNRYGNWLHAVAAYNCGAGNVDRAIKKAGGSQSFWDIFPYLPTETRGYVPAFIATIYVMTNHKELGLSIQYPEGQAVSTTRVPVTKQVKINHLESRLHIPAKQIKIFNPSLLGTNIPAGFQLTIPQELLALFNEQEDTIYALAAGKMKPSPFKDTLLATKVYKKEEKTEGKGSAIKKIFKKEPASKKEPEKISPPQETTLSSDEPEQLFPDDPQLETMIYSVKPGDNMGFIAFWFHCSVKDIKQWNALKGNQLAIGQELLIYITPADYDQYARFEYLSHRIKNKLSKRIPDRDADASAMNQTAPDEHGKNGRPLQLPLFSHLAILSRLPEIA